MVVFQSLKRASRPSPEWGPANLKDRHGRYSSEDTKAEVPEVSESRIDEPTGSDVTKRPYSRVISPETSATCDGCVNPAYN